MYFQGDVLVRMEQKGIGFGIGKWAPSDEIFNAINKVIGDKTYAENIRNLSDLMKLSLKQKPMENAIWWLEFLSATKGAEHLKLSSRHLNFFQYYSIDFILICGLILVALYKLNQFRKSKQKEKKD